MLHQAPVLLAEARRASEEGLRLASRIAVLKAACANATSTRSDNNNNPSESTVGSISGPRGGGRKHRRNNQGLSTLALVGRGSRRAPAGVSRKILVPSSASAILSASSSGFAELDELQLCRTELTKSVASLFTVKVCDSQKLHAQVLYKKSFSPSGRSVKSVH